MNLINTIKLIATTVIDISMDTIVEIIVIKFVD